MTTPDEPVLDTHVPEEGHRDSSAISIRDHIQRLVDEQPYAVLCVQGGGQPYGALVAFAFSPDLRQAVFATPKATRKYRLLGECNHVAMVIDNRPSKANEVMEVEAVTATGRSQLVERGDEFDRLVALLLARHPYLASFVKADTCALFRVDTVRFLHVMRFQEVSQWVPTPRS
jgi:nitroimidazol reductase NimA-like FMN-containing flavoprotein (pyridoxamine 5'-phosphate oxidase superfamily)